jgi:hypothetical protein
MCLSKYASSCKAAELLRQLLPRMIESRKAPRYVLRCRAEIDDWAAVDDCLLRNVSLRRCYDRGLGRGEAHEALEGRAAPGRVVDKVKKQGEVRGRRGAPDQARGDGQGAAAGGCFTPTRRGSTATPACSSTGHAAFHYSPMSTKRLSTRAHEITLTAGKQKVRRRRTFSRCSNTRHLALRWLGLAR